MLRINDEINKVHLNRLSEYFADSIESLLSNSKENNSETYIAISEFIMESEESELIVINKITSFVRDLKFCTNPLFTLVIPFIICKKIRICYITCVEKEDQYNFISKTIFKSFINKHNLDILDVMETFKAEIKCYLSNSFHYQRYNIEKKGNLAFVSTKLIFEQINKLNSQVCYDLMDFASCNTELNIDYPNKNKKNYNLYLIVFLGLLMVLTFSLGFSVGVNCTPPKSAFFTKIVKENTVFEYKNAMDLNLAVTTLEYFLSKSRLGDCIVINDFKLDNFFDINVKYVNSYFSHPTLGLRSNEVYHKYLPTWSVSHSKKFLINPIFLDVTDLNGDGRKQFMDCSPVLNEAIDLDIKYYKNESGVIFIINNKGELVKVMSNSLEEIVAILRKI